MIIAVVTIAIAGPVVHDDGRKARTIHHGGDASISSTLCATTAHTSSADFVLIIFVEHQVGHQVSGPIRLLFNNYNVKQY